MVAMQAFNVVAGLVTISSLFGSSGESVGRHEAFWLRRLGFPRDGEGKKNEVSNRRGRPCQSDTLTGPAVILPASHRAIPCWVAPLQSPTPFHLALEPTTHRFSGRASWGRKPSKEKKQTHSHFG